MSHFFPAIATAAYPARYINLLGAGDVSTADCSTGLARTRRLNAMVYSRVNVLSVPFFNLSVAHLSTFPNSAGTSITVQEVSNHLSPFLSCFLTGYGIVYGISYSLFWMGPEYTLGQSALTTYCITNQLLATPSELVGKFLLVRVS